MDGNIRERVITNDVDGRYVLQIFCSISYWLRSTWPSCERRHHQKNVLPWTEAAEVYWDDGMLYLFMVYQKPNVWHTNERWWSRWCKCDASTLSTLGQGRRGYVKNDALDKEAVAIRTTRQHYYVVRKAWSNPSRPWVSFPDECCSPTCINASEEPSLSPAYLVVEYTRMQYVNCSVYRQIAWQPTIPNQPVAQVNNLLAPFVSFATHFIR